MFGFHLAFNEKVTELQHEGSGREFGENRFIRRPHRSQTLGHATSKKREPWLTGSTVVGGGLG